MTTYVPLTVRQLLEAICEEFEGVITEAERSKGGMHVDSFGGFSQVTRFPSVVGEMRWWVREFRSALEREPPPEDNE